MYAARNREFIEIWDREKGMLRHSFRAGGNEHSHALDTSFSPCGRWAVVSQGLDEDNWVPALWNLPERKKVGTLQPGTPSQSFMSMAFSADGAYLAVSGSHAVRLPREPNSDRQSFKVTAYFRVWDVARREIVRTLVAEEGRAGAPVSISADGKYVLQCGGGGVNRPGYRVWNAETGELVRAVGVNQGCSGMAYFTRHAQTGLDWVRSFARTTGKHPQDCLYRVHSRGKRYTFFVRPVVDLR